MRGKSGDSKPVCLESPTYNVGYEGSHLDYSILLFYSVMSGMHTYTYMVFLWTFGPILVTITLCLGQVYGYA